MDMWKKNDALFLILLSGFMLMHDSVFIHGNLLKKHIFGFYSKFYFKMIIICYLSFSRNYNQYKFMGGEEFLVAYEEAMKHDGKVIL